MTLPNTYHAVACSFLKANRCYQNINLHRNYPVGNDTHGLEVWRTADGMNWHQLITGAFGDSNNAYAAWDNAVARSNNRLYLGTWLLLSRLANEFAATPAKPTFVGWIPSRRSLS